MCLGVPGRLAAIDHSSGLSMGTADFGGVEREVCLAYVPDAAVGDFVVVHAGFAISRLDEAEARRTLEILRAMGDVLERELTAKPGA
ncbi:HypC/HybG/HupF family hydrogenase formation chaperone [Dactylosporangium sp. NPDC048998]|uniref:HypC/HybG/HupF family hydrogenase formation chaperone n=1 Tax=Dactylosporangium sp. NPDC048998 TaxID=3363976 RepID=UPI00372394EF